MRKQLIMMKGLPGSGKSTRARDIVQRTPNTIRVNRDDLRSMVGVEWSPELERSIGYMENGCAIVALEEGYSVVVDDTNLKPEVEARWRIVADDNEADFSIVSLLDIPIEHCINADAQRAPNQRVGKEVILRMAKEAGL